MPSPQPESDPPSDPRAQRRRILARLGDVSSRLEALLAGQDVTLGDLPLPQEAEPGETPRERLEAYRQRLLRELRQLGRPSS